MLSGLHAVMTGLALFLPFLLTQGINPDRELVHVVAAFYSGRTLYLYNDNYEILACENGTGHVYKQDIFAVPPDYKVTAATFESSQFASPIFIYFSHDSIYYGHVLDYVKERGQFAQRFPEFVWHGINAATTEGEIDYYFHGCEYITKNDNYEWDTTPRNVADLGLPCDVDAAWNDGKETYVLKGNLVWKVNGDVTQPLDFDEYFHQDVWEMVGDWTSGQTQIAQQPLKN